MNTTPDSDHNSPLRRDEPGTAQTTAVLRDVVPFGEATRTWFAISLQTFGGPAGQIAVMQRTLVDDKRWIGQQRHAATPRLHLSYPCPHDR